MTFGLKVAVVTGLSLAGLGLAGAASAMPAQGLHSDAAAGADVAPLIEKTRLLCPPYRPCYYVPGPYYRPYAYRPYGYYPYPYAYRPYWRRHWLY